MELWNGTASAVNGAGNWIPQDFRKLETARLQATDFVGDLSGWCIREGSFFSESGDLLGSFAAMRQREAEVVPAECGSDRCLIRSYKLS